MKANWDKEILDKELVLKGLEAKFDKYKHAFNFVGLYDGFSSLAQKKKVESKVLLISLLLVGVIIFLPLLGYTYLVVKDIEGVKAFSLDHLIIITPVISIEIILLYFFRIILLNHRSVKAQILQIELRQTLCQFIEAYTDYSHKIKKVDPKALEKFENLIFSGILSNSENLPSTFDGVEQITNMIKNLKSA
ncbi:hypothetical protein [Desulfobotulus mexicanus]|uniref:Uncharacterized protein n=1 Tax=Desulfobotulus mexicanus TaxID=2586642 RepID=A0A5S5MCB3_9BACT|nr:hypothetical protein [Desulfobotulus mexicanus]TYT73354.1 hypothetical protein FIM25_15695 [Desulfobotulus mexicanus]